MTLAIGLTGGIGCGKSTAAGMFAELGAGIIDTDEIAHSLTAPGQPALQTIREHFGDAFFLPDGSLDRAALRRLIFSSAEAKAELEAILHPLIRREVETRAARNRAPYLVIVVPLLLEAGNYRQLVQRAVVVDCEEETQVARATGRGGLTASEVRAIMANQMSRSERLQHADDILSNGGELENLRRQVAALHAKFMQLARPPACL